MSKQDYNSPIHYQGPPPRRAPRWLRPLLISMAALGLLALLIKFVPPLFRRTASTGRLLSSHPDMFRLNSAGQLELAIEPSSVPHGQALPWRELWHDFSYDPVKTAQDESLASAFRRNFHIADFDGDGSDEVYVAIANEHASLLKLDGTSRLLGEERNGLTFRPTLWDGNADGATDILLGGIFKGDGEESHDESQKRGLPVYNVDNKIIARIRDDEISLLADLHVGDFLGRGDRQLAYEIDMPAGSAGENESPLEEGIDLSRDIDNPRTRQFRLKIANMKPLEGFSAGGDPELELVADIDGDGRDELLYLGNSRYRCFGWNQAEVAGDLPGYYYPSLATDMDGDGVDELIYCHGDSMLLGHRFLNVMMKALSQASSVDLDFEGSDLSVDEMSRLQIRLMLESVKGLLEKEPELQPYAEFIEEMISRDMTNIGDLENNPVLLELLLGKFGDMLEPQAGILELLSGELTELRFPADRHPSHFFIGMPGPLTVCQLPGRGKEIWLASMEGGGLFGFDAAGNCIYQENFGEAIKGLYTANSQAGQALIVEFADRLMICDGHQLQ